ncbi:DUF5330 domain-containing protein [Rhodoligotrophos defluvii]|uniref:DUF5330 domain-containing protein n=1 Tax=Rhodoligotrophos defluvii TaxID=2561934 RepID=UPI0010C96FB9|nr:DUF5330 domain-containing protein [Rhodoligotrophos defluvii]
MSLFRIVVILVVIIMILPIGDDRAATQRASPESGVSTGQFVDAAVSAAYDVSGICSRQPVVCAIGHELWTTFQRKFLYIAGLGYDWLNGSWQTQPPLQRREQSSVGQPGDLVAPKPPAKPRDRLEDPSDTLTEGDLLVPWHGPATPAG